MNIFLGAPRFRLGWILVIIAALNGFVWTAVRWSYENSYSHVQITLDYDDTRTMADAYQVPHKTLLTDFRDRGVTSIALYEQSLANLRDNRRIDIVPREEAERLFPQVQWKGLPPAYRDLITTSPENQALLPQIVQHLRLQSQPSLPPREILVRPASPGDVHDTAQYGIVIPASRQLLSDAQMGFDPAQVKLVRDLGMLVTARIPNPVNLNLDRLRMLLDEAQQTGAHVVICSEEEVLGYNSIIKDVAREMRKRELLFGNIEFTKQRGWDDFSRQTEGMLVRVHSVGGDEVAKAKIEMLIDRYARAVKERNIRVAYIRLIRQAKGETEIVQNATAAPAAANSATAAAANGATNSTANNAVTQPGEFQVVTKMTPLEQNLDFVGEISRELKAQPLPIRWLRPGLVMGGATGFHDYPLSVLEPVVHSQRKAKALRALNLFLSGLGAVGGTLLLLNLFFDLRPRAQFWWLVIGVILVAGLSLSPGIGAKLMALQVGCVFSTIGVLWGGLPRLWDERGAVGDRLSVWRVFLEGTWILLKTTLLTMIGPLLIVALLNYWKFFSGADKFLLPKATQLLPILLVGIAFGGEVFPHRVALEGAAPARRRARARLDDALSHPFTARIALVAVVLFILGSLWIARTGNDSGMEISPVELKFRALLERVFVTRPRTKEIFMGMPAMIFAVWLARRRQNFLAIAAVLLATIGQADVLNTFCHIHTPIFYSLLRTIHGVWLGAVMGGVLLWLYSLIEPLLFKPAHATAAVVPPGGDGVAPSDLVLDGTHDGSINGKAPLTESDVAVVK